MPLNNPYQRIQNAYGSVKQTQRLGNFSRPGGASSASSGSLAGAYGNLMDRMNGAGSLAQAAVRDAAPASQSRDARRATSGLQPTIRQPDNFDLSKKGYGEQFFENTQGAYTDPSSYNKWYDKNASKYDQETAAQQHWQGVQGAYNQRNLSQNLNPYYDRAFDRGAARVNQQMAARGMYGSSAATNQIGQLAADLGAEQANREGQYGLQLDAANRDWMSTMGQAAGMRDNNMLDWLNAGGTAAFNETNQDMSRLNAGQAAATAAQQGREGRIGGIYDRQLGLANATAGVTGAIGEQAIADDQSMYMDQIAASLGVPREALNQYMQGQASARSGLGGVINMAGSLWGNWTGGNDEKKGK